VGRDISPKLRISLPKAANFGESTFPDVGE
jgi:hypothetical protein